AFRSPADSVEEVAESLSEFSVPLLPIPICGNKPLASPVTITTPARARVDRTPANLYLRKRMEVDLTPDQTAFVRQAIKAGRLHRPEEAVREALSMWGERERRRAELLAA